MPAQYVHVPLTWAGDDVGLMYCPVCGSNIATDSTICDHVIFSYLDEVGFYFFVPELARDVEEIIQREDEYDNIIEELTSRVDRYGAVCLRFTGSGPYGGFATCIDFSERARGNQR